MNFFRIRSLFVGVALLLGVAAAVVLCASYFLHDTTVEIEALVDEEILNEVADGAAVSIEVYDRPLQGELLATLDVDPSDITETASGVLFTASDRTRSLPGTGYLQVCVDRATDGHPVCGDALASDSADLSVGDAVSCTRTLLAPRRSWLSSTASSFANVTCDTVSAPLILDPASDTRINFDGTAYPLPFGDEFDLTEAINAAAAEQVELHIGDGSLSTTGADHDDDQRLELDGTQLTITGGNQVDLSRFVDATDTNTDSQVISARLAGSVLVLQLTNGGSAAVDLSSFANPTPTLDTDDQTLSLDGNDLVLSNGDAADSVVDLSAYLDNVDTLAALSCSTSEFAVWDGSAWACQDVQALETLTSVGYDIANQTITYTDEDGVATDVAITSLETTTVLNNTLAVGNIIGTYTNEDGTATDIIESVTTIADNGDGTFSYTAEDGTITTLDVADMETLTTVTNTINGNQIATYTDEDGVTFDINETITALADNGDGTFTFTHEDGSVSTISVASLETLTSVTNTIVGNRIGTYVSEDGSTFDINETITSVVDNGDQTFTFTAEDGTATTLDVTDLETLTTVTNTVAGNQIATYTDEDGATFDINETITELVDNGDGTFTFTHEDGSASTIDAASLETLTTLTNTLAAGNLIGTYTDEDGNSFDLNETITSLVDNGDQTFTFTAEDGSATTLDVTDLETLTTVTNTIAGNRIGTYTDEDGATFDLNETITALADNGDGTFSFTHEDGSTSTIDAASLETLTLLTNTIAGNRIATYTDEDGVTWDIDETITSLVDNGDQTFTFTGEDGSDVTLNVTDLETLTTITNTVAGNRIATYTDEDGVTWDVDETITALADNGDGTFTFTHEDGSATTIDAASLETLTTLTNTLAAGQVIGTYTDEDGVAFDLRESVTTMVDNGDQTFTFTSEDGTATTLDATDLETLTTITNTVAGNLIGTYTDEDGVTWDIDETITALADNGDQTFTFTHEDGSTTDIDITDLETLTTVTNTIAGNQIGTYTDEDGATFDLNETITALADNGDGTFTFTHEDGSATTIDAASLETLTTVTNTIAGNRIATYTDEDGVTWDVDETITALADNGDGTFTFTHEDGSATTIDAASLETLTTLTNTLAAGNLIGTYTDEDGVAFDLNESITSLVDNGDQTFTFTAEDGTATTLDVTDLETLTTVTNTVAGNLIATYTDEDGATWDIDETITALADNGDGTFTFTHEDGSATTINAASLETLTTVTNTIVGNTIATYTDEDGVTWDIDETITTLADNGDGTFTFTDEDGAATTLDVANLETLTTVTNTLAAGNLIAIYTDEDGGTWDLNETITTLVDNGDQTITFTGEDGTATTVDITNLETLTTVTNTVAGNTIGTYTDEDGATWDLNETITELVDNGDGTFTFTHEDGSTSTIDAASLETVTTLTNTLAAGNLIGTYTDEDGVAFDLNETITSLVDNGDQTFTFTAEDGTATTLDVTDLETLTTITNTVAGNLIGTYTDEDGATWDVDETITELADNGDGTFTFTHEDGSTTDIDAASLETLTTVTNTIVGNTIATYTDEDGATWDIDETITTLVDNGDQTFTFTGEDGTATTLDVTDLETLTTVTNTVAGNLIATYTDEDGATWDIDETITTLVDNGNGTFTFTHEDGSTTNIDAASLETLTAVTNTVTGNRIATYTDEDGATWDIDETITTLADNGNGTFTFTHEDGSTSTIDGASLETLTTLTNTLAAGQIIGTYTDEAGSSFDLRETITTLVDNGDGTFTSTSEDGTVTTVDTTTIETVTAVTNTVAGNRIATYTDEDGNTWDIDETITDLADNGDGTFTFTHEDGSTSTLDAASLETLTTVTNTIVGSTIGTYTDEDGNSWDIDETITELADNGDGTFTFTHEDGSTSTIDAASLESLTTLTSTLGVGNRIGVYTDEDGVAWDLNETITTLVDNGDDTFTFTNEDGSTTTVDTATIETVTSVTNTIAGNRIGTYTDENGASWDIDETITGLVDNGDGTYTFTHEDGSNTDITGASLETLTSVTNVLSVGNQIGTYTDENGATVDLNETVTSMVDNGDGTFTFTAEDGTPTTISSAALETLTTVTNTLSGGNLIGTYVDEVGATFDINESITSLADNGDGTFTFTAEDGTSTTVDTASLETLTTVTNVLASGQVIGTYTDEDGNTVDLLETVTTLVGLGNGTYQYTSEDGTVTTITNSDVLDSLSCAAGEYVQFDGTAWQCVVGVATSISAATIEVDTSFLWAGDVVDPDLHTDVLDPVELKALRSDAGWSAVGINGAQFAGSPDHVMINLTANTLNTGNHWARARVKVYRNGVEIGEASALHMDNSTTYSGMSTVSVAMIDESPGANPVYTFSSIEEDSRTLTGGVIAQSSPFSLKAVVKETVVQKVSSP